MTNSATKAIQAIAISFILVSTTCSKLPDKLVATVDGQLVTMEWSSISVEMIPLYNKGVKMLRSEPYVRLDSETMKQISKELSSSPEPKAHYQPAFRISEASHKQAVEKLASLLNISVDHARNALPSKDEFRHSVTYTEITEPILRKSDTHILDDYSKLVENMPYESVICDTEKLYNHLVEQAQFLKGSKTLAKLVQPQSAYAIRKSNDLSKVMLLIVPEDREWAAVNAYYTANH
jgi:hypothetical protein